MHIELYDRVYNELSHWACVMPNPDKIEYSSDLSMQEITFVVSKELSISVEAINSRLRLEDVVFARQLTQAVAYAYSIVHRRHWSLAKIGIGIGGRDHATVLHARKTISGYIETGYRVKEILDVISLLFLETKNLIYQKV
jgi:chromosomal replication initiator protein